MLGNAMAGYPTSIKGAQGRAPQSKLSVESTRRTAKRPRQSEAIEVIAR